MKQAGDYFAQATKNNLSLIDYVPNGKKAVLRRKKEEFVGNTLDAEARFMNFDFRIRSLKETAEFTDQLRSAGILVPEVYEASEDFLIEEYIEGTPLSEIFPNFRELKLAEKFLDQVVGAHRKGLVIGERWGKNEILRKNGEIIFVDLDVEYLCDFAKELELVETVNAIAVFSQDKEVSRWLGQWLSSKKISNFYNLEKIVWLLEKHIEFWGDKGNHLRVLIDQIGVKALKIGIDIDDCLASYMPIFLERVRHFYGVNVFPEDINGFSAKTEDYGYITASQARYLLSLDRGDRVLLNLPAQRGAAEAVNYLSNHHQVILVTSRDNYSAEVLRQHTLAWLKKSGFNYQNLRFSQDKEKTCQELRLDILIEDSLKFAKQAATAGTQVILFAQPWNAQYEKFLGPKLPKKVVARCDSWQEIVRTIEKIPISQSRQKGINHGDS